MNFDIRKTAESKLHMRKAGAALSFAEKLRIVEGLVNEGFVKLAPINPKPKGLSTKQHSPLIHEIIQQTLRGGQPSREFDRGSESEKLLVTELENLLLDDIQQREFLQALFPEGIQPNTLFFQRLASFEMRLGWEENAHQAIGALLFQAIRQLPLDSGEELLREITNVGNQEFFQLLYMLKNFVRLTILRPEFSAEWFPSIVSRVGNDLGGSGVWDALEVYCESHTENSLFTLHILLSGKDDAEISVGAYMLGLIRTFDLSGLNSDQFDKIEASYSLSSAVGARAIYNRSWIRTAHLGGMDRRDLNFLVERMFDGAEGEREDVFWIVCKSLSSSLLSSDCFEFGMNWLGENVSGDLSHGSKYHIVELGIHLSTSHRSQVGELILEIQPILSEHQGIWNRLEYFLVTWLENDFLGFVKFSTELANRNAKNWVEIFRKSRSFDWFLSELKKRDASHFISGLLFSSDADSRDLGIFLFEKLELESLPEDLTDKVDVLELKAAFYGLQRAPQIGLNHGSAIARYLIMLLSLSYLDQELKEMIHEEFVFQLKNYPGSFRKECEKHTEQFPILRNAIDEADQYFQKIQQVRESGICAMEVSGYRQALRLYSRRFSTAVTKGSEEGSELLKLFKKVRLLYGKNWTMFNDGKLGETSSLTEFSSSFEIPRLEEIDPEGMVFRRVNASISLEELRLDRNEKGNFNE